MRKLLFTITSLTFSLIIHAQVLYTTTLHGGANGGGTICKLEQGKLTAAFNFDTPDGSYPRGKLLQASDGKLYGLTSKGGKYNVGTIFSYNPATHAYIKLKDFDTANGAIPDGNLVQAKDGKLYGITHYGGNDGRGVIFSYDINTGVYTRLTDFDQDNGSSPFGSLVEAANGKLYGMTSDGGSNGRGVIFSLSPVTHVYTKLVDFNNDAGWYATGSLLRAKDGKLYGITSYGGKEDNGVIFSLNPATSAYTKLIDLTDSAGSNPVSSLVQASDGKLYGMSYAGGSDEDAAIFSFTISTSAFTKLKDLDTLAGNAFPGSLLQANNGKLYGISSGRSRGKVGIFSFSPATNKYTIKHFKELDGFNYGNFMQSSDGKLYGMSYDGGGGHIGTLFSLDITTLTYTRLRDFGINDLGYEPRGVLAKDDTGVVYGITTHGGRYGKGVIFSFNTTTAVYKKLRDWDDAKRVWEVASLLHAANGKLYGVNPSGGNDHKGTIFSLDPVTGVYTTVMYFTDSATGYYPHEHLIQAADGKLYGMTISGGSNWAGVLFSYDPSAAIFTRLYDLSDSTGSSSYGANGNLIQASDGKLYGMTAEGGKHKLGVFFSYDINTAVYTRLIDFDYFNGAHPYYGGLVQAANGKLYGTTNEGGEPNNGVLFSYNITTGVFARMIDFTGTELNDINYIGERPTGCLTQAADGKLYGIWKKERFEYEIPLREQYEPGGVYSFDPVTATYTKLQDFDSSTGLHPMDTFFTEVPAPKGKN